MFNKKKDANYISGRESRAISRQNRKITRELEKKRERKHVDPSEYTSQMHDPNNVLEVDNLHTYFFTDIGTVVCVNDSVAVYIYEADIARYGCRLQ